MSAQAAPVTAVDNAARIGARLRRIRNQQGLSLADVQERSNGVWKAVVVGAYERGDRAVTVTRLSGLAEFYGVSLADLLPDPIRHDDGTTSLTDRIMLDLTRLDVRDPELSAVARFADHVRGRRGDHNGRVMTLRGGDVQTIAMADGRPVDDVLRSLAEAGVLLRLDANGLPSLRSTGTSPLPRSDAPPAPAPLRATPRFPPAYTHDLMARAVR